MSVNIINCAVAVANEIETLTITLDSTRTISAGDTKCSLKNVLTELLKLEESF